MIHKEGDNKDETDFTPKQNKYRCLSPPKIPSGWCSFRKICAHEREKSKDQNTILGFKHGFIE